MERSAFVKLLESVRDHLTIAIHAAQSGDTLEAIDHVEQAGAEMQSAAEELRAA